MNVTLYPGDNRETLRRLIDQGVQVHSVVTDPPYGLVSVQKRFGKEGAAPARTDKNDGSFARLSGGFMGKAWDGTGIERDPEFWKLIYDILLPGGYVFAFSGSRTGHWQACAMEMAGFIMHPMHGWVFGSGFPKAHNAARAVDQALGKEGSKGAVRGSSGSKRNSMAGDFAGGEYHDYMTATPEAAQWQGWAYGTQAQKPALEPIYLGQKPFSEKTGAANLLKHGVGAVNIDGCRVPTTENLNGGAYAKQSDKDLEDASSFAMGVTGKEFIQPDGRHPANLILDGSPEVAAMFPNGKSGNITPDHKRNTVGGNGLTHGKMPGVLGRSFGDEGSTARFFHQFTPDADPLFYHPKAGKQDRGVQFLEVDENGKPKGGHPTVKPIALMQYLIRHITPPGGIVLDPFAGSGTTGEAAKREGFDCILMEAEPEYVAFLERRFAINNDDEVLNRYLQLLGL